MEDWGMSDFATLGVMIALAIANSFLVVLLDRWVHHRADGIVSGAFRGVQVPVTHRRRELQVGFVTNGGGLVAMEGILAFAWVLIGKRAGVEELRLLANLIAFLNAMMALGWALTLPTYYRHLASILRQAKAD
jgi:hypothetical protein